MNKESLLPQGKASSVFYSLGSVALVILGLITFQSILKPIVIAALIWFIIYQLKNAIARIRIKGRSLSPLLSNILAFIIIFGISYLVIELLIVNVEGIVATMPEHVQQLNEIYSNATALVNNPKYAEQLQKWVNEVNIAGLATSFLNSLTGMAANFAIVLVYVVFFLMEESERRLKIESLFPDKGKAYKRFMANLDNVSRSIRSYIWSKTMISLITGGVSYVVLLLLKVEYAFLWSFLVFVLNYIPYIGPLISSLLPAIFAVVITGDLWQLLYVFGAMEVIQIFLGNFIEPAIMGKGTNLSPVTVLVSLALWSMIWGIVGMILAVPITSVLVIICSQIPTTRYLAIMLSEKGDIPDLEAAE